jgi:hypothetical protein
MIKRNIALGLAKIVIRKQYSILLFFRHCRIECCCLNGCNFGSRYLRASNQSSNDPSNCKLSLLRWLFCHKIIVGGVVSNCSEAIYRVIALVRRH